MQDDSIPPILEKQLDFKHQIYSEFNGTLASRIDIAWVVYKNIEEDSTTRIQALNFLIYAFDLNDSEDINDQLISLMDKREKYKKQNPSYIPGKANFSVPFDPATLVPNKTSHSGQSKNSNIRKAIKMGELLDISEHGKESDAKLRAKYYQDIGRAQYRVLIHKGLFKKHGKIFNTSNMRSHGKKGFAAYTLNSNGELSLFEHIGMRDRIGHSSMNAGAPVISAGEIAIENGRLIALTTYSGHYQPSLFNVYRILEYFEKQGVDISQAQIITFSQPSTVLNGVTTKTLPKDYYGLKYTTPATDIYDGVKGLLKKNLISISKKLADYEKGGIKTSLFKFKDWFFGSNLTVKRANIAGELKHIINNFNQEDMSNRSESQRKSKTGYYKSVVEEFIEKNNALSREHGLACDTGRLANQLNEYKSKLQAIHDGKDIVHVDKELSKSFKSIS